MAERSWARTRIEKPVRNDRFALLDEVLVVVVVVLPFERKKLVLVRAWDGIWFERAWKVSPTFDWASDMAATITPAVSIATENICHRLYLFPHT